MQYKKAAESRLCLLGCQWFALLTTTIGKNVYLVYVDFAWYGQESERLLHGCRDDHIVKLLLILCVQSSPASSSQRYILRCGDQYNELINIVFPKDERCKD